MIGRARTTLRTVTCTIGFLLLQSSGWAQEPAKEPVPDWLAWQVFQESIAFHSKQSAKAPAAPTSDPKKKTLFSGPRPTTFQQTMKKQFGLTPEHTAALLTKGQSFLAALSAIQTEAKAEVNRRYLTRAALAAQASGPRKTIKERSKEDGLDAEVQGKRQAALTAHLEGLSQSLTAAELAKVTEWVRTGVGPRITQTPQPTSTRTVPTGTSPARR